MSNNAGVWIDHRKAVIVALESEGESTTVISSQVVKHLERGGDSPLRGGYEARQVPADDRRQRALTGELNAYYDSVIVGLRDADRLVLLGPGEAKGELRKRLLKEKPGVRILATETEDKMTELQIAAKVRSYFGFGAH
jgi:hypothetical protein